MYGYALDPRTRGTTTNPFVDAGYPKFELKCIILVGLIPNLSQRNIFCSVDGHYTWNFLQCLRRFTAVEVSHVGPSKRSCNEQ